MAFSTNFDASTMGCAAGEPMEFAIAPFDANANRITLDGRAFVYAIYDDAGNEVLYTDGQIVSGTGGQSILWALDGTVSNSLVGRSLNFEFAERLNPGKIVIKSGKLSITPSAKNIPNLIGAGISRYITLINWYDDPNKPRFTSTSALLADVNLGTSQGGGGSSPSNPSGPGIPTNATGVNGTYTIVRILGQSSTLSLIDASSTGDVIDNGVWNDDGAFLDAVAWNDAAASDFALNATSGVITATKAYNGTKVVKVREQLGETAVEYAVTITMSAPFMTLDLSNSNNSGAMAFL